MEMRDWQEGNILIGRGLNYYKIHGRLSLPSTSGVGWGHLGYIAYLCPTWPHRVFRLWDILSLGGAPPGPPPREKNSRPRSPDNSLGAAYGSLFLVQPLIYLFSGSFLMITYIPGILIGAAWSIALKQPEVQPDH